MNILLIPTTDNIVINWEDVYKYFHEKGHKVYIITDNKLITKNIPEEYIKLELYVMKLHQLDKLSVFQKLVVLVYLNIYAKHILKKYAIDNVVVSNDNSLIQNVFTNIANTIGIETILHQAAGIFEKPKKINPIQKIKNAILKKLFNFNPTGNIGKNVNKCFLQGNKWIEYVDNKKITLVGNHYYYNLNESLKSKINSVSELKSKYNLENKQIVTFFSQPFKELNISSVKNIDNLYSDIEKISELISEKKDTIFIFKPHPQEKYYKNFKIHGLILEEDVSSVLLASNITITIYSTMAIQSKIANKSTIGFTPRYLPKEQTEQMKPVFDFSSTDINDLVKNIDNNKSEKDFTFTDVVDLSLNTKEIIYKELL